MPRVADPWSISSFCPSLYLFGWRCSNLSGLQMFPHLRMWRKPTVSNWYIYLKPKHTLAFLFFPVDLTDTKSWKISLYLLCSLTGYDTGMWSQGSNVWVAYCCALVQGVRTCMWQNVGLKETLRRHHAFIALVQRSALNLTKTITQISVYLKLAHVHLSKHKYKLKKF